jgi:protein RecA
MPRRVRLKGEGVGDTEVSFFSTGCAVLDATLGGGWAECRMANLIGDKSTGKTLLAVEAAINFLHKHRLGVVRFVETEAALDRGYAEHIGIDWSRIELVEDFSTVEDVFEDLDKLVVRRSRQPILYIIDSLDSLSDRAELARTYDEGTYGATKAKQLSQAFRRLARKLKTSNITVLVVSQTRSRIVSFGRNKGRSGGEALNFYASQILWLSEVSKIQRTRNNIKRTVGIEVDALCDKNKVGLPFRTCRMSIFFYFGIDDVLTNLDYLKKVKRLGDVGLKPDAQLRAATARINSLPSPELASERERIARATLKAWRVIETGFIPARSKYGQQ